ncbi:MAG: DNA/RNA non-specific endonuclease [Rikenellaceae bacterium]
MKSRILLIAALFVAVGCQVVTVSQDLNLGQGVLRTISVAGPSAAQSRVSITPDDDNALWSVEWCDKDQIALCSTDNIDLFTVNYLSDVDNSTAEFSGTTSVNGGRLVYPYTDGAISGDSYSIDLSLQNYDVQDPYNALGQTIPLVSDGLVDLAVASPSATMRHIGAALTLNFKFSDLEQDATYAVERITLKGLPATGTFDIGGDVDDVDFLTTTSGDIALEVANSPLLVEEEIYSYNLSILPFSIAVGEGLELVVKFSKSVGGGEPTLFECSCTLENDGESSIDFVRGAYHTINKLCVVDKSATVYIVGDDMEYGYQEDVIDATFDDVDYTYYYFARLVNAVPLQMKSKMGYIYNTTPLEWLSQMVITVSEDSSYRHDFTVYAGTTVDPLERVVLPEVTDTTLVYTFPSGCSHFAIYNESSYSARAVEISISYGTAYGGVADVVDDEQSSGSSGEVSDVDALSQSSPYTTLYAPRWSEVPAYIENENYQYVTHSAELNDGTVRNFSLCFDSEKRAAIWVAFPYHEVYAGDAGRTDKWGFDPIIDELLQASISSSYADCDGVSYDRGHQISSGDRLATEELNAQTFYYSNMTPQNASLNRGQWSSLEDDVRAQVCADTLYVVTGADFSTTLGVTTDAAGNECPIPAAYFKVMVRTCSGDSGKVISECSASELQAIGYWVENIYTGVLPDPISVSEVEEKTGLTFFPGVPQSVKDVCAARLWIDL